MLVAIVKHTKRSLGAGEAERELGPFLCPQCREEVSLRKGTVSMAHFAHKPKSRCSYGTGETDAHRRCKMEIFERLRRHPSASGVELEHRLGENRPDVFAYLRGLPVAIELQLSNLPPEVINRRTQAYTRRGVYVLWLLPWTPALNQSEYSPRRFERWIHATYYGRVYFWLHGLTIAPYRFESFSIRQGRQQFVNRQGRAVVIPSHDRFSKRFKRLVRLDDLDLVRDFVGITRPPWRSKSLDIPRATLFIDRYGRRERQTDDFSL